MRNQNETRTKCSWSYGTQRIEILISCLCLSLLLLLPSSYCRAQQDTLFDKARLSKVDKIYLLSSFWKDAHMYFYSEERLISIHFDSIYKSAVDEALNTDTDYEFYRLFERFVATIKDGHTTVNFDTWKNNSALFDYSTVMIDRVNGRYYIVANANYQKDEIPLGAEVIQMNQIPIDQYLNTYVLPYCWGSTQQQQMDVAIQSLGSGVKGSQIPLRLRSEGKEWDVLLEYDYSNRIQNFRREINILPFLLERMETSIYLTDDNYLLMQLPNFTNRDCISHLISRNNEFKNAKGIILDLRNNGGGNEQIADSLLMCFLSCDTLKTYPSVTKVIHAMKAAMGYGYKEYAHYYTNTALDTLPPEIYLKGNLPTYSQPLVILVSNRTVSAAEDFLLTLKLNDPKRAM